MPLISGEAKWSHPSAPTPWKKHDSFVEVLHDVATVAQCTTSCWALASPELQIMYWGFYTIWVDYERFCRLFYFFTISMYTYIFSTYFPWIFQIKLSYVFLSLTQFSLSNTLDLSLTGHSVDKILFEPPTKLST
jgi:hypothetical protein